MKQLTPVIILFVALTASAKTITLTATAPPGQKVTNSIEIAEYEAVELIAIYGQLDEISFQKDGGFPINFTSQVSVPGSGRNVVAGPCKVNLVVSAEGGTRQGVVTLVVRPESFPPDRTITVGPGIGGATITLECSTALVNWPAATKGVYTNLPATKFFRIKADRIP